jgi:LuxR family transcriptional regulator, maltose regulon positive regulatory protein
VSNDGLSPRTDVLSAGHEALALGHWAEARAAFEAALAQQETPEALEGLGLAAWWLDDAAATFDARERAYRLYRERGDRRGAARMATWLSWDYSAFRGEPAIAIGWLQRAHRLLEGLGPGPEQGWLRVHEGAAALFGRHDTVAGHHLEAEATALGAVLGLIDLGMVGRALEGVALVTAGEVTEGMRRLDEVAAAVVAGELRDLVAISLACCHLITACERVRDYDRAAQWCARVQEFCQRWHIRPLFAFCCVPYAAVLLWRSTWVEAEAALAAATRELAATRPAQVAEGTVWLAELRRCQGRADDAAALFEQAELHPLAQLGRAALALDRGNPTTAAALAERFLRHLPPAARTERAASLELLIRARVACGDRDAAGTALAELQAVASAVATEPLRASANFAEGIAGGSRRRCRDGAAPA